MARYRKKPVVIDAFLLGYETAPLWFRNAEITGFSTTEGNGVVINTLEGDMKAYVGKHYIIKGVHGELYPCEKNIFEETYEEVK